MSLAEGASIHACFQNNLILFLCSQGKYWIKNFQMSGDNLFPWAPEGLWRVEAIFANEADTATLAIHLYGTTENGKLF